MLTRCDRLGFMPPPGNWSDRSTSVALRDQAAPWRGGTVVTRPANESEPRDRRLGRVDKPAAVRFNPPRRVVFRKYPPAWSSACVSPRHPVVPGSCVFCRFCWPLRWPRPPSPSRRARSGWPRGPRRSCRARCPDHGAGVPDPADQRRWRPLSWCRRAARQPARRPRHLRRQHPWRLRRLDRAARLPARAVAAADAASRRPPR